MDLRVEAVRGVSVVEVPCAELDAANAGELKQAAEPVLRESPNVVFDLSRVQFIDSSGLGAFLSCLRLVRGLGGELKLCALSNGVRAVFELVRMQRVFAIYGTREEAVAAFESKNDDRSSSAKKS